ncbi:MAG: protein-disulfide reductase DsbD N-terminal domain-containing protein [Acidobacteriota bacterium]
MTLDGAARWCGRLPGFVLTILLAAASLGAAQEDPVTLAASSATRAVKPGGAFLVRLVATIADGWHLYSLTQPPPPVATTIRLAPSQPFDLDGDVGGPAPVLATDPNSGETVEFYDGEAPFTIPVKASPKALPGMAPVRIQFRYQACNDSICLRPTTLTVDVAMEIVGGKTRLRPVVGRWTPAAAFACCST